MSIEERYVRDTYNIIAKSFDNSRYRPWSCVEDFLNQIPSGSKIGDIGCGNGKNMLFRKDCENIGCDFTTSFVDICIEKGLDVVYGDTLEIPFEEDTFDYTISIAVIHHLSTEEKRKKAISELIRTTNKGGRILILVWALEQEYNSKRKFITQENMVDWKDKQGNLLGQRYYYVFIENELESLIPENIKIIKSFYEKGNWGIIIEI